VPLQRWILRSSAETETARLTWRARGVSCLRSALETDDISADSLKESPRFWNTVTAVRHEVAALRECYVPPLTQNVVLLDTTISFKFSKDWVRTLIGKTKIIDNTID
jgi:hypothetical protein